MSPAQQGATILVIDDTAESVVVVVGYLEKIGYRVVVAQEGEEGIERALLVQPDLILLDVLIPGIDGFETCRRLKSQQATQDIPVIFMTALTDVRDKIKAYEVGGIDYVTKPFQQDELLIRVNTHLSLRAMQQLLEARNQQLQEQISERQRHRGELRYHATHDTLTGLPNRTLLQDRLDVAINRARFGRYELAVMFIDLDKFKHVNDTLGHSAGDELLQQAAKQLQICIRKSDTLARIGGDEFIVLVENFASEAELEQLAARCAQVLAEPVVLQGQRHYITASIGISIYPRDGDSVDMLLKHADIAMYQAKERGRNTVSFFTWQMQDKMVERLNLERRLQQAIERDEFVLHYQPQIDLRTGLLCGIEALIRWQSPELGLVLPSQFIPAVEESPLISEIGSWVLETVCKQLKAWQQLNMQVVPVAINVASQQFLDTQFDRKVRDALLRHHIDSPLLELELTETTSMHNPEAVIEMMCRLKKIGVSIVIDDFGVGYSNLGYLKRFPVNKLKIDHSFIRGITKNPEDRSITQSVIRLAHCMELKTVAEGVETEGQLKFLLEDGCDLMQGFYFRPALPEPEILALLRQRPRLDLSQLALPDHSRTVLLVDDEPAVTDSFKRIMRRQKFALLTADSPSSAYEIMARYKVDVVISDFIMPEEDGIRFLARVRQLYPETLRILTTGDISNDTLEQAINKAEAFKFIPKPHTPEHMLKVIEEAFQRCDERRGLR